MSGYDHNDPPWQVDTSHGSTSVTSSVTSLFGTSVRPQSSSSEAGSGYHRYTFPDQHQPQQQPASDEPHLQPPQDLNWAGGMVPIHPSSAVTTISSADIILARNVDLMAAPPSGQLVRLRQGKSPSEGYVQMFSNNEWGWVGVTCHVYLL